MWTEITVCQNRWKGEPLAVRIYNSQPLPAKQLLAPGFLAARTRRHSPCHLDAHPQVLPLLLTARSANGSRDRASAFALSSPRRLLNSMSNSCITTAHLTSISRVFVLPTTQTGMVGDSYKKPTEQVVPELLQRERRGVSGFPAGLFCSFFRS